MEAGFIPASTPNRMVWRQQSLSTMSHTRGAADPGQPVRSWHAVLLPFVVLMPIHLSRSLAGLLGSHWMYTVSLCTCMLCVVARHMVCARQFFSHATSARGNAAQGTSLPTEESNVLELLWTSRVVRVCAARICVRQVIHFVLFWRRSCSGRRALGLSGFCQVFEDAMGDVVSSHVVLLLLNVCCMRRVASVISWRMALARSSFSFCCSGSTFSA